MKNVVKTTTNFNLLDLLCPYTCRGCGALGEPLCECCRKNIAEAKSDFCLLCNETILRQNGVWGCQNCKIPLDAIFAAGYREDPLHSLVSDFKYRSMRRHGVALAELLNEILPSKCDFNDFLTHHHLDNLYIVPLPTNTKHLRARGFDHTKLLARHLARLRDWEIAPLIGRAQNTVQVGASAAERQTRAKKAYYLRAKISSKCAYLLLDDVWTTGSTMLAAANLLKNAGAKCVMGAVIECGVKTKSDNSLMLEKNQES